jgi:hypothetical protein
MGAVGTDRIAPEHGPVMMAYVIEQRSDLDAIPIPEVKVVSIKNNVTGLTQVRFEDAEQGDISSVVAANSAPRLTETCLQACDLAPFASAAGLTPGQVVTVVLMVEVLADGSTGLTDLVNSSGNVAADGEAIRYARSLHWIPGTKDHRAVSMRIRFPITLTPAMS